MTQYSTLNVKFSTSQLNKLKSEIKIGTEINNFENFMECCWLF